MNQPSREQIEARITALLLGELPAEEAGLLRWTISQDAGLQKLHDRLKIAVGLVRETVAHPAESSAEKITLRKLSDERRRALLTYFKTPRPKESFWLKPIRMPSLIPVLVTVAIIAVLAAMMLPALAPAKRRAASIHALSMAKERAMEEQIQNGQITLANPKPVRATPIPPAATPALPPQPVLAPPPAEIVLPQTEQAPAAGPVNSATVAGYANAQNNFGISPPADSFATGNGASRGGGMGGAGGGGGSGGGVWGGGMGGGGGGGKPTEEQEKLVQVEEQWSPKVGAGLPVPNPVVSTAPATPSSSAMLAFDDSGANRSGADNKSLNAPGILNAPVNLGEENRRGATAGATEGWYSFAGVGAITGPAPEGKDQTITVSPRMAGEMAVNGELPSVPTSHRPVAVTKIPGEAAFGDAPVVGRMFQASSSAANPAGAFPENAPNVALGLDVPAATPPPIPTGGIESSGELPASGSGTLALNGNNSFAGGTVASAGTITLNNGTIGGAAGQAPTINGGTLALGDATVSGAIQTSPEVTKEENLPAPNDQIAINYAHPSDISKALEALPNAPQSQLSRRARPSSQSSALQQREQNATLLPAAPAVENGNLDLAVTADQLRSRRVDGFGVAGQATVSADSATHNLVVIADKETADQIHTVVDGFNAPATTPPSDGVQLAFATTNAVAMNTGTFYNGVTRDNVNGLRSLLTTNNTVWESTGSSTNDITLNFQNAPVATALNYLSDKAGFVIVQDTPVQGNVTLSGNHLTPDEALNQLNSELNRNGYAAIRDGRTLTIVSKNESKTADNPLQKAPEPPPIPQPEFQTRENAFSTFSLNVSDVSFKLAAASLEQGRMPDAASIRSEEFINAFNYRDPEAAAGQPLAFASERARDPFAQNRDLLRFSVKTAALGRQEGRALNLVLLLDTSGSMERADRVLIIREALRVLASELQPQDTISVVTFARTPRLWADGVPGDQAGETLEKVGGITPEGGTNLEEAMRLAYETARRHYLANGMNRVVVLTDGAANLGNVDPAALTQKVEAERKQGIALDCFGIGWEGYNDDLLEQLSSNGDGRYAFINSPDEAGTEFAAKLAGALQVAAQDVKVQVEFNPQRVVAWRQIGYAKHQLTKEQFRDNSVAAAAIAAQEAGNALYTVETKPDGIGPVATVRVRYRVPGTEDFREHSWDVDYDGGAPALEQSSAAMRLAAVAAEFSEWLAASPFAQEVTPDELLQDLNGVPAIYGADPRPQQLEWMIRQAKSVSGK